MNLRTKKSVIIIVLVAVLIFTGFVLLRSGGSGADAKIQEIQNLLSDSGLNTEAENKIFFEEFLGFNPASSEPASDDLIFAQDVGSIVEFAKEGFIESSFSLISPNYEAKLDDERVIFYNHQFENNQQTYYLLIGLAKRDDSWEISRMHLSLDQLTQEEAKSLEKRDVGSNLINQIEYEGIENFYDGLQ